MHQSPFEHYPVYFQEDNRRHRAHNPITLELLVNKHRAIFDGYALKGMSVLDLGAGIGASGEWVLYNGASSYTGVEAQGRYAEQARRNLAHHAHKARIEHTPIEHYLSQHAERYDYVLILAVLHVFFDFMAIIRAAAARTRRYLIIENLYPTTPGSLVEFSDRLSINLAGDEQQSMAGLGVRISPEALDLMLLSCGFVRVGEIEVAPLHDTPDVYNDPTPGEGRYLARYQPSEHHPKVLSEDLTGEQRGERIPWVQSEAPWVFDDRVAANFNQIAASNIPHYAQVIDKCIATARALCTPQSRIIDVGSALGYTLERLHSAGFTRLYGVDNSASMLRRSWRAEGVELLQRDSFPTDHAPFRLVLCNWTLHFIEPREAYLESIYQALEAGGALVLSEKVTSSELATEMYHGFKRASGISEREIANKRTALERVLITRPVGWYLQTLERIGFTSIDIIDASYSFVTLLARK